MKYYTAFLYKDKAPDELHCTHKYFGELNPEQVKLVISIVTQYIFYNVGPIPVVNFHIPDKFGAKYDTRVLKPSKPYPALLTVLKTALDRFKHDTYGTYRPHVTCDLENLNEPFDRYALVSSGGVVIMEWKL